MACITNGRPVPGLFTAYGGQVDVACQPDKLILKVRALVHQLGQIGKLRGAVDLIRIFLGTGVLIAPIAGSRFSLAGSIIYTDGLLGRVDLYRPFPTEGVPVFPIKAVPNRAGRHQRDRRAAAYNDKAFSAVLYPLIQPVTDGDDLRNGHS